MDRVEAPVPRTDRFARIGGGSAIVFGPQLPEGDAQMTLYAEYFAVGDGFTFGSHTVTMAEIVEFGEKYHP